MTLSVGKMLLETLCLVGATSCAIIDDQLYSPQYLKDYDSKVHVLEYKTGDHFKTLKTMFLTRPTGTWFVLEKTGISTPTLKEYNEDPSRFRWIVRVVPPGTEFLIVGIKGEDSPGAYTQLEGQKDWIGVPLKFLGDPLPYMKPDLGGYFYDYYDREFFQKLN